MSADGRVLPRTERTLQSQHRGVASWLPSLIAAYPALLLCCSQDLAALS